MADGKSGVLADCQLADLHRSSAITCERAFDPDQVQPASLDLRLGFKVYRIRASFLPGKGRTVKDVLGQPGIEMHSFDLREKGAVLETGCVYLVELQEGLALDDHVSGRANPKSSTGRIDVFTRVVTDRSDAFDDVPAGYQGPLWLEISPRTFPVLVRPGDRLAQLRLRRGDVSGQHEITVSIDLDAPTGQPVGWRAKHQGGLIDLRAIGQHDIPAFWEPLFAHDGRLVLDPEEFYILASRESVSVAPDEAAEMAPIAPELGEFRAHYAGFFDPGFGTNSGGSRAVLEVRSRDVPFILEHGQPVAKLIYEPMSRTPDALYGGKTSNYQGQGLKLSKHFKLLD